MISMCCDPERIDEVIPHSTPLRSIPSIGSHLASKARGTGRGLRELAQGAGLDLFDPYSSYVRPADAPILCHPNMLDERSTLLMKGDDPTVVHLQDRRVTVRTIPPEPTAGKHRLAISAPGTQHHEETS